MQCEPGFRRARSAAAPGSPPPLGTTVEGVFDDQVGAEARMDLVRPAEVDYDTPDRIWFGSSISSRTRRSGTCCRRTCRRSSRPSRLHLVVCCERPRFPNCRPPKRRADQRRMLPDRDARKRRVDRRAERTAAERPRDGASTCVGADDLTGPRPPRPTSQAARFVRLRVHGAEPDAVASTGAELWNALADVFMDPKNSLLKCATEAVRGRRQPCSTPTSTLRLRSGPTA